MKYEKISNNSSRYIITCYLLIAIILNICLGFLAIISDIVFEVKFKLTLNFIFLTINIFLYIWAFLISTIVIKNYKFTVKNKKIDIAKKKNEKNSFSSLLYFASYNLVYFGVEKS